MVDTSSGITFERIELASAMDELPVSYVLTLAGSPRRQSFMMQLQKLSVSRVVYIVHNQGYKRVHRDLCRQEPAHDISYAHAEIMRHALAHHPRACVLVFEDDFFWCDDARVADEVRDACRFVRANANTVTHYFLGGLPIPSVRALSGLVKKHCRTPCLACHAVIHTPTGMRRYVETYAANACNITHADLYMARTSHMHYRPLAYQLFPRTANQQLSWPYVAAWHHLLNMHRCVSPGYAIVYAASWLVPLLVVCVLIVFVWRFIRGV